MGKHIYSINVLLLIIILLLVSFPSYAIPPIVFVTQPPHPNDFATANATFGNHRASLDSIPRGGDLYIRYSNGTLKNLTLAAGYGNSGFQGASSIAVRDPAVHWSGQKIIFSMVIGAPTSQYQINEYRWQLYEISNLGQSQTPVITKVSNQPEGYNNVMPTYGTDERIIFVSDRPRGGITHHYPQRDEYEKTPTNTGLWSLNSSNGNLIMLDHSPSGDFDPIVDSFGRVLFVRWDHLQRDQQNRCSQPYFQAFNYSSEAANATQLNSDIEVFPEPRADCEGGPDNLNNHSFNHFLPWQIHEDGKEMETLNHIGRHELVGYLGASFNDDDNVEEFYGQYSRQNQNSVENFFHIEEDPTNPGTYYGINAPEFGTHTAGQIFKINGAPSVPADQMLVTYITHPDTANTSDSPSANHTGLYRHAVPLSDGTLVATHTTATRQDTNIGTSSNPASRYSFRLKTLSKVGSYFQPASNLTAGITKAVSYWSPDEMINYNTTMWELQAVELRARTKPARRQVALPQPETLAFQSSSVDLATFKEYLVANDLALVVSRNITSRDNLDHQQPRNLKVENSTTQTVNTAGKIYNVAFAQFFQGDLIRGYDTSPTGRRVLAQPMHDGIDHNITESGAPAGSVRIGSDGSMAAIVPARRALSWQLTNSQGVGIVRERVWLTFQPGEIRVCASCHGVNSKDQMNRLSPQNTPQALIELLEFWKGTPRDRARFGFSAKLAAGKINLKITGENTNAANKTLQISAKVGKTSCSQIKEITTDGSGNFSMNKAAPLALAGKKITFVLQYLASEISKKTIKIPGSSKTGKKSNAVKLCNKLMKKLG